MKKKLLILCTGNSCRSQIAEGYAKYFYGKALEVYSAGVEVHGVNPRAIKIMAEEGIDISSHTSNHVDEYEKLVFDYVVTVCDSAKKHCPVFPSESTTIHHAFPDPAKAKGTEEEILASFRSTRNLIKEFFQKDFLNVVN